MVTEKIVSSGQKATFVPRLVVVPNFFKGPDWLAALKSHFIDVAIFMRLSATSFFDKSVDARDADAVQTAETL